MRKVPEDSGAPVPSTQIDVEATNRQLNQLRDDVDELLTRLSVAESTWSRWLTGLADEHRASARNMLHYWAIRQFGNATCATYKPGSQSTDCHH
jgi:pyruvate kinase